MNKMSVVYHKSTGRATYKFLKEQTIHVPTKAPCNPTDNFISLNCVHTFLTTSIIYTILHSLQLVAPDTSPTISTSSCEKLSCHDGTKSNGDDYNQIRHLRCFTRILMSLKHELRLSIHRIPELHASVFTSRDNPFPIRAQCDAEHKVLVTDKGRLARPCARSARMHHTRSTSRRRQFPQLDSLV